LRRPGKGQDGSGGRNVERDFHGEKRKNDTHSSTTDPDARLFRKSAGKEAKLCHMGHLMMENRNGLIIDARLTEANGTAERTTALDMIEDNAKSGSTVGGDKNYDTADFVAGCRERGCTPHVSQNDTNRRSAIDARTTRHPGYRISTIKRKRIEEPFGWMKTDLAFLEPPNPPRHQSTGPWNQLDLGARAFRRSCWAQMRSHSDRQRTNGCFKCPGAGPGNPLATFDGPKADCPGPFARFQRGSPMISRS
jgi:Transposase DDE domain